MFFDCPGVIMAAGAGNVHVGAGNHLRRAGGVGIVAIRATGLLGMDTAQIFLHYGEMTLLAGCP